MKRKYIGHKKSIEAWSDDRGRTWRGQLFDAGRATKFSEATLQELDQLAAKHQLKLAPDK